jgi:LPS export ABC transporter protein LptC
VSFRFWILATCALALLGACRRVSTPVAGSAGDKPNLIFFGFSARAIRGEQLLWEARARQARVFDAEQRALAEDVELIYYADGKAVSTGYADRARMDLKRYDVEAEGHVRVQADNGTRLYTSRLRWDNAAQRVFGDARVRVVRGGTVLSGRGFSADRGLRDVRILADVQAESVSLERLRREAGEFSRERP